MLQSRKADLFRQQHAESKLLLLPNVWDTLTARLIASLGFPSLATASAAIAATNGYPDGEHIPLNRLLELVSDITGAVGLPVSVDFERGYSNNPDDLKENIRRLLDAGAIGINIEDGLPDRKGLLSIYDQCKKIELIRNTASSYGVDLVINARTDLYLQRTETDLAASAIQRGKAYHQAGADCFYPILMNSYKDIEELIDELPGPVNILLTKPVGDLRKLEDLGVKRVSLGPGMLKYMLTRTRSMAEGLRNYNTDEFFEEEPITNDFLASLVNRDHHNPQ